MTTTVDRPTMADLVELAPMETVVRLDGPGDRLDELVLTGDVRGSLAAVMDAARGERGAGFFLVGPFGSGKSHFLAALAQLFDPSRATARVPARWDAELRQAAADAWRALIVRVPLIEHRAQAPLEDVVWRRAWGALGEGLPAPAAGADRVSAWRGLLAAARSASHPGLVILVDELSEFLRAKQGPPLTEDLRFLQFLGEWAGAHPVVVVAALQEDLDEIANVSERELARIRDRYPRTLSLSMRHVEDLVRGRLVRVRPGAEHWIERAYRELASAFPGWQVTAEGFARCYPIHPAALELLGSLRFLLSQQRGAVDFICRQLRADPARDYLDLVTPDRIYDHFHHRLRERIETRQLAAGVVPHFERHLGRLFPAGDDRALAVRSIKLLTLLAASRLDRSPTAAELAAMLLVRVSAIDPAANAAYLDRAVLQRLIEHGAYVVAEGHGGNRTFQVRMQADAVALAGARVDQARARLRPGDVRVLRHLLVQGSSHSLPLDLLRSGGMTRRELMWQNTLRAVLIATTALGDVDGDRLRELDTTLDRTGAEMCLLVALPDGGDGADADPTARAQSLAADHPRLAIWVPDPLRADETAFAVDLYCRCRALDEARADRGAQRVAAFLARSVDSDKAKAREIVARCWFQGRLEPDHDALETDLPSLGGLPFDRVLRTLIAPRLDALHPDHRSVQPHAELVGQRLVGRLLDGVMGAARISVTDAQREHLQVLVDAYLVPAGLVRRHRGAYVVAPDPARNPALADVLAMTAGRGPVPVEEVVARLARGRCGLSAEETLLLLNAAARGGLVEVRRRGRRVTAPFLTLRAVDAVESAELVDAGLRERLPALTAVVGAGPFEPWTTAAQHACWEHARTWMQSRAEDVAAVRRALTGESAAAFGATGSLADDARLLDTVVSAVGQATDARDGLERLLTAASSDPAALLSAADRVQRVARFLRADADAFHQAAAYLRHPHLSIPAGERELHGAREEALAVAHRVLPLAAEDRAADVFDAFHRFRDAYAERYLAEHRRAHAGEAAAAARAVRGSPAYATLATLAGLGGSSVPHDRVAIDRMIDAALPAPCTAPVDVELRLRPSCSCGLRLGSPTPQLDAAALDDMARRGVVEHLTELFTGATRERIQVTVQDLASLGRDEVADDLRTLLRIAAEPAAADIDALSRLLRPPLVDTLRTTLAGTRLVVRRDLGRLREQLVGRRYPRRRVLALMRSWLDDGDAVPDGAYVDVVEDVAAAPGDSGSQGTAALLHERYPSLAALLPAEQPVERFWLAAWWNAAAIGEPPDPTSRQLTAHADIAGACAALLGHPRARAELADLDRRVTAHSVLGDQIATALDVSSRPTAELGAILRRERLLTFPLRLLGSEIARRVAVDWRVAEGFEGDPSAAIRGMHHLARPSDLRALDHVLQAGRLLAGLERHGAEAHLRDVVETLYPTYAAPVRLLLSRARTVAITDRAIDTDALWAVSRAADAALARLDERYREQAAASPDACLAISDVGREVIAPLVAAHGRVAVLVIDAMRADLWLELREHVMDALGGRELHQRWAVVPEPTRTREAVSALYLGRPVAPGSAAEIPAPFPELGHEATALAGADRASSARRLMRLWSGGAPISVAIATGVDQRLHHTPVELDALVDDCVSGLRRHVIPSLRHLPDAVPLVVLADHGFREHPGWGDAAQGRYGHGGPSMEESIIPVAAFVPVPQL